MNPTFAERNLQFKLPSGAVEDVVVRFFVPYPIAQGDWQCDYEIRGDSVHRILYAVGIDSVQALSLALNSVRVRKLPRQAGTSKVELSAYLLRYSTGVIPPSESWDLASL
ncbi:hypothetical protein ACCP96_00190 [Xanthomonas campestris pv. fici]|uniref:DUF6968 family protein n=1 Tax=Xanthomonas euvesicatoria TaxID=456327 RepID=UPI0035577648